MSIFAAFFASELEVGQRILRNGEAFTLEMTERIDAKHVRLTLDNGRRLTVAGNTLVQIEVER